MSVQLPRIVPKGRRWWLLAAAVPVLAGFVIAGFCFPEVQQLAAATLAAIKPAHADGDGHDHSPKTAKQDDHDHAHSASATTGHAGAGHAGEATGVHGAEEPGHEEPGHSETDAAGNAHDEAPTVKLSTAAQANVGLRLAKVELRSFERTVTVPGIIVERPGKSAIQVSAPLTGMIARVCPMQGESVTPGQPLFDLRLTHEEVVEAQAEFLRTAEELDVIQREITRLEKVTADGAVPGKTMLERKYEQQKLQAAQRSQRQKLLLHGLSSEQVEGILRTRTLLSSVTIAAPAQDGQAADAAVSKEGLGHALQVEELKAIKGQHVKAGDPLCVLADHSSLLIQGKAFEQDSAALDRVANNDWRVTAMIDANGQGRQTVSDLPLLYVANKVETDTRAFLFYAQLPNKLVRNRQTADGHRFSAWQFKPGQRVEVLVPVERWADRIVLPLAAVIEDGAESYVFEKDDDGDFIRRTVRVEYRDQYSVVVANDGALASGKTVIVSGSYQVHLAMKNKAGGAPDPHAGHNH
jgi:membrane fusion protein, heavy metal efflux system